MTEQKRPTSGGRYKRDRSGKLKAVHQPDTAAGTGPRNAKGELINSRHQVLDPETHRPIEDTAAADTQAESKAKKSDKKGGE